MELTLEKKDALLAMQSSSSLIITVIIQRRRRRRALALKEKQIRATLRRKVLYGSSMSYDEERERWSSVMHALKDVTKLNDPLFYSFMRMSKTAFQKLLTRLGARQGTNHSTACGRGGPVPLDRRLAITIRILAACRIPDVRVIFGICEKSAYSIYRETFKLICDEFQLDGVPDTEEKCLQSAIGFNLARGGTNPIIGCIGALDGILVQIGKPDEGYGPAGFFCRYQMYAISVQAVCDSNYRFLYASAICKGGTHDSMALAISSLGEHLREKKSLLDSSSLVMRATLPRKIWQLLFHTGNGKQPNPLG